MKKLIAVLFVVLLGSSVAMARKLTVIVRDTENDGSDVKEKSVTWPQPERKVILDYLDHRDPLPGSVVVKVRRAITHDLATNAFNAAQYERKQRGEKALADSLATNAPPVGEQD